jgi:hypothetical protein
MVSPGHPGAQKLSWRTIFSSSYVILGSTPREDGMGRYDELAKNQRRAVLDSQGVTEPSLRRAVAARAAALGGGPSAPAEITEQIPESLRAYVDSIALHAYEITDEDIAALRRTWSEDEVFEVSVAAAVGAGLARLERGLAILQGDAK